MGFDSAYEAISEDDPTADARWAFGTGFDDPLAGVDTSLPDGVDGADVAAYCVMLGDDALIASQRLQQWITRLPELEEETAIANIALDLLGQARLLLTRAGTADGTGRSEDDFAYRREPGEFRNVTLAETGVEDFGGLVLWLLAFSTWRLALTARLRTSRDPVVAAIAASAVKELTYHREYAAQWVVRLGDSTEYARARLVAALPLVEGGLPELFATTEVERRLADAGVAVDPSELHAEVDGVLGTVLGEIGMQRHDVAGGDEPLGRDGAHSAGFGALIAELQEVARQHPGATW